MVQPTLATERLKLRPFTNDDLPPLAEIIFANTEVMRTLPQNDLVNSEDHLNTASEYIAAFTDPWDKFGWGGWAITFKESSLGKPDQLVGFCGFQQGELSNIHPEIGYGIGQPWWGKGITSEAAKACVGWMFGNTDVTKIWGVTYKDNVGSQKILRSLGMVHDEDIDLYESISKNRGLMPYFYITKEMYEQ
jgi:[ribosomal protein S5]-alanine N-acetyltransferase